MRLARWNIYLPLLKTLRQLNGNIANARSWPHAARFRYVSIACWPLDCLRFATPIDQSLAVEEESIYVGLDIMHSQFCKVLRSGDGNSMHLVNDELVVLGVSSVQDNLWPLTPRLYNNV